MEHIVQFGISIDDVAIKEEICQMAEQQLVDKYEDELDEILFDSRSQFSSYTKKLSHQSQIIIEDFLEKHRDKILEMTSEYLATKLARTKRGKELLEDLLNNEL